MGPGRCSRTCATSPGDHGGGGDVDDDIDGNDVGDVDDDIDGNDVGDVDGGDNDDSSYLPPQGKASPLLCQCNAYLVVMIIMMIKMLMLMMMTMMNDDDTHLSASTGF